MKKCFIFFLIFYLCSFSAFAASFPDVPEDHENYNAIEFLETNEILSGYDDGTFKPNDLVNRAEAMKIISGAFNIETDASSDVLFPDVPKDQWFFEFVMGVYKAGIVKGYEDGKFKPGNNINLAETLKILPLAAQITVPENVESDVFLDVTKDSWYAPYAFYAREHNIILADDSGKINADTDMTRASFAEVIYRMMTVQENDGEEFPLSQNWPYYEGTNLPFKIKYDSSDWDYIELPTQVVFYKLDTTYSQFTPFRTYPNSARIVVALDENENGLTSMQYFNNLRAAFNTAEFTEFSIDGMSAIEVRYGESRQVDWYIYLDSGEVLGVYTEYGSGVLGFQLTRLIKSMLQTLEYKEVSESYYENKDSILSTIFENILIEGQGMAMLDTLPDKVIIETDTIGVGTGPVDYYYCETLDYSFKYERESDLILDSREGKTSAF
ncbi:hypothetical protein GF354_06425 [Candidatus Peregrinibacteria bacterium]|nr:hypothetical protein [Candidatus Peregrinibacteria bacterium]